MVTLTIFLILLGASGISSKKAESEGPKPKGKLVGDYYKEKYIRGQPVSGPASPALPAPTKDFNQVRYPDGTFYYRFYTDNGIYVEASGYPSRAVSGDAWNVSPEGFPVVTMWNADEAGFHTKVAYNWYGG